MNIIKNQRNLFKPTKNWHLLIWLFIVLYYVIFYPIPGSILAKAAWVFLVVLNFSFSYYILLLYIWPKILNEKKIKHLFSIVVVGIFFSSFYYFQLKEVIPWLGGMYPLGNKPNNIIITKGLVYFTHIFFISLGTYFNWIGVKKIEDEIKMNKEIIEKELLFLKSQFHSHLTFNFLNFCYNKIRHISAPTAVFVEEFSDMLRYSLKGSADELVPLEEEIQYIENSISFQQCLTNDLNIKFSYEGDIKNSYILPRILVVFIENSLKHGVLHDPQNPIEISIKSFQNEIFFNIKNRKNNQGVLPESGIGIQNIKHILNFFYKDRYLLSIENNNIYFTANLQLKRITSKIVK
jgi:two-component system LytT family sensor kinase